MGRFIDLTGQKFGRLTVTRRVFKNERGDTIWECKCDCGNIVNVRGSLLKSGNTRSCGCYRKEETNLAKGHIDNTVACRLNAKIPENNTSGVRGVSRKSGTNKWLAKIGFKKKVYLLGCYPTLEEAAEARKEAESRIWGDFLEWYENEFKVKKGATT